MRFTAPFLAAAVAAFSLVSCSKSLSPAESAKSFFEIVKAGRTEDAYHSSAFAFKAQQSQNFFDTTLKQIGLTDIASAEYQPAEFEDGGRTAKVRADFQTAKGATIPLVVTLTQESGRWKVFAIKSPRDANTGLVANHFSIVGRGPDFVEPVNRQPPPDEETVTNLVNETILGFGAAIKERDFLPFFEACSLSWQDQLVTGEYKPGTPMTMRVDLTEKQKEIGASRLHRAFQPFIDKEVDLSGVAEKKPILDGPPQVSTDGLLVMSGHFDTQPYRVVFSMKFIYELPKWKLFGLDVSLRK
jgi:hypothetical protein